MSTIPPKGRPRSVSPRRACGLALLALLAAGPAGAQWTTGTPMPAPRYGAAVAAFEGKIYVIGGRGASGNILSDAIRYDPVTEQWSSAGFMDNGRANGSATVFNGELIVTGGRRDNSRLNDDMETYSSASNTWIETGECYHEREGHVAFAVGNTAYAVGGFGEDAAYRGDAEFYQAGFFYWQQYGSWNLAIPRASFGGAVVGDGILIVGGYSAFGPLSDVELYVPNTAGQMRQPLPTPRGALGAATIQTMGGPRVYAVGGRNASNAVVARVDVYDPAANQWTPAADLPAPREAAAVVALGDGRLFVIGGRDAAGATATTYVLDVTVAGEEGPGAAAFALGAPVPNPAAGAARLDLVAAEAGPATVEAFDALGRRVAVLHEGPLAAGTHPLAWDGRDEAGAPLPAGVYVVRARQGARTAVRRLTVAR